MKEILKLAMDSMKNHTLNELLEHDMEYQKNLKEEWTAYQSLETLGLTEEQRDAVETLLTKKNDTEYDRHINCYMAGMLDAYEILKFFDLTKE